MFKRALPIVLLACLFARVVAQPVDETINARIRAEEHAHSQIMRTLHVLTDVYGPRLTGSPSVKAAGEWAIKTMESWGFSNGHLEPWEFGHPGWANEQFSGHIVSPVKRHLVGEVAAWTPGTNGLVKAQAYNLILPDRPTPSQLTGFLLGEKSKVNGRIVLVGRATDVPVNLNPPAKRRDDEQLRRQYDPNNADAGNFGRGGRGASGTPPPMTAAQIAQQVDEFLVANGAKLRGSWLTAPRSNSPSTS